MIVFEHLKTPLIVPSMPSSHSVFDRSSNLPIGKVDALFTKISILPFSLMISWKHFVIESWFWMSKNFPVTLLETFWLILFELLLITEKVD